MHYWVNVQDKQRLESGGTSVGVARGPYGGYGWGAGYGGGVTTYDYKEGTLILDLIEPYKEATRLAGDDRRHAAGFDEGQRRTGQRGDRESI